MATENWFQSDSIVLLLPSCTTTQSHHHYTLWTNNTFTSPLHTVNQQHIHITITHCKQQHIHITITHCEPTTHSHHHYTLWTNNTFTSTLLKINTFTAIYCEEKLFSLLPNVRQSSFETLFKTSSTDFARHTCMNWNRKKKSFSNTQHSTAASIHSESTLHSHHHCTL